MAKKADVTTEFQRKIQEFCRQRFAGHREEVYHRLRDYLTGLVSSHRAIPMKNGKTDWHQIALDCDIDYTSLVDSKPDLQHAIDAITRWRDHHGVPARSLASSGTEGSVFACLQQMDGTASSSTQLRAGRLVRAKRGPKPKEIEPFPTPLFDDWIDPPSFKEALELHMRRFGESYWHLFRAVTEHGETFDHKTLFSWLKGTKVPRSVESFEVLERIEMRYRLPDGYFKKKLPHQSRAASGHRLGDMSPSEQRRLAWHLPDDFNALPFEKQEEIVQWVRRVIISGATDYRQFQAAASKQRYAVRFPGVSYGRFNLAHAIESSVDGSSEILPDPDLLQGVIDASPRLAMEMADLMHFKTATLSALGFQRNGVWGAETASQKLEHLGLMFGALVASPNGPVRGYGVPIHQLTFGMFVFPGVWDWYVQWRERRRGFYTCWEVDMLCIAMALTRHETGWLRQHQELLQRVTPITGLIRQDEIEAARSDWSGTCDAFHRYALNRMKEVQRVAKVHRDPFEPIMPVLEAQSPVGEYRKITDEILKRMPDRGRYPRAAAEAVRSFLLLRLGLHLGLRQKNLRQLLLCPRGQFPTSERRLEDLKRGEIRWSDRENGWEVFIPAAAFKNANSSFFGKKPFRLVLPDLHGLYRYINDYVVHHRSMLLGAAPDPATFFVKTVKATSRDAAYDQTTFYEAWRLVIQRYGIYNPYTQRGAIIGLLPHGPHNVRDVLATHILKQTGSYEQASYAIQDTPEVVANHYGRFLPQDKSALAAKILNQVWEAA